MKFGIHNSSLARHSRSDRGVRGGEGEDAVGRRSRLYLVVGPGSHDPDPRMGAPDEPFLEGGTVLSAVAAVATRVRLSTLCTAVGYRNP
jgi:alkanesulfonate monooxygenase SsuD/methylene tetrahydromethanopterin reductase-like flavin-dependent oxidoreductase (luciferase family)